MKAITVLPHSHCNVEDILQIISRFTVSDGQLK